MDLIYTNEQKVELGVLKNFKLDMEFGIEENNFELTVSKQNHVCGAGSMVYVEGTDYGGIIDAVRVDTTNANIVYKGATWHGILESKVIEPDAGEDYLIVNGDANEILALLIERLGLSKLFRVSSKASKLFVSNFPMRYLKGYTGIKKMLATVGGKLKFRVDDGIVIMWAESLVDYSKDDEFDSEQIEFIIEKKYKPTNHMICLGRGDLKERTVIHLYADKDGNISRTQSLFGIDEKTDIYDNANAESEEELEKGGIEAMQKAWNKGELQLNLEATQEEYDIGDVVGAKELVTGIFMARAIAQKIVTIENEVIKITHKVGE